MPRIKRLAVVVFLALLVVSPEPGLAAVWRVQGESMEPELHDGAMVIVDQVGPALDGYRRGDVVILEPPGAEGSYPMSTMIKRVIGLPGEHVQVVGPRVTIDGRELDEPYVAAISPAASGVVDVVVAPDSVFVMGDHRGESFDSTSFGAVPVSQLHGRVVLIIGDGRLGVPAHSPIPGTVAAE